MKKTLAAAIALILMLTAITLVTASCSGGGNPDTINEQTTDAQIAETEETTTAPELVIVPQDFGGMDFTFFGVETHSKDWVVNTYSEALAESENGDPINDALFRRTIEIEEAFNIVIKAVGVERTKVGGEALKVILAGDNAYQAINLQGYSAKTVLNSYNSLYNLYDIDTIDLSHSWWDKNSIDSFTVGGKLFNVVGDMNIRSFFSSTGFMFSKQMIEDYNLESPFKLIDDGVWTIDKLIEQCEAVTHDVNGDGHVGYEDTAGLFGEAISLLWGLNAFGEQIVTNVNGTPEITLNNERVITGIEKYVTLLRSNTHSIWAADVPKSFSGENIFRTKMLPMLMENRLLYYSGTLVGTLDLRSMESDFGIIPKPKFDESQDGYYSSTHPQYLSFTTIPVTNSDPEGTGTILEAMHFLSQKYVFPAIYDTTIINKVIRDEETGRMLDIIRFNRVYDIGYIFDWGGASSFITAFSNNNNTNFASSYASVEPKIQAAIDSYLEIYSEE